MKASASFSSQRKKQILVKHGSLNLYYCHYQGVDAMQPSLGWQLENIFDTGKILSHGANHISYFTYIAESKLYYNKTSCFK